MRRFYALAAPAIVAVALVGCGGGSNPADDSVKVSGTQPSESAAAEPASPEEAVFAFLEAVKQGNDARAGKLLTERAQQKTAELDMVVAPPGSDTASFEVGEVEAFDDGARVASTWTDVDHQGNQRIDQITWILKNDQGKWRIAGMATPIFPGQDPVVLNFENPQEMIEKQRVAEAEALKRAKDQNLQARQTEDPYQQQISPK